ncbi:hypothetical protein BGZ74_011706 [Mortierella antarctica]|nr:hypothetical protein BGZ74_011706 [Mortierella antarctica]
MKGTSITFPQILSLALFVLTPTSTSAHTSNSVYRRQSSDPTPPQPNYNAPGAIGWAYTHRENDALYMYGGDKVQTIYGTNYTKDELYKLDLSTAWTTSEPVWTRLPSPDVKYPTVGIRSDRLVLLKDGSALFAGTYISGVIRHIQSFNTRQCKWMPSMDQNSVRGLFQLGKVTDLDTGLIYDIASESNTEGNCYLSIFDPARGKMSDEPFACGAFGNNLGVGAPKGTYSTFRRRIYYLETPSRFVTMPEKAVIQSFNPADKDLTVVNTTGDIPDARVGSCFAVAYGGSKLILLGGGMQVPKPSPGQTPTTANVALKDVYMLPRAHPVANYNGTVVANMGAPSILNLKDNVWVKEYTPAETSDAAALLRGGLLGIYGVTVLGLAVGVFVGW